MSHTQSPGRLRIISVTAGATNWGYTIQVTANNNEFITPPHEATTAQPNWESSDAKAQAQFPILFVDNVCNVSFALCHTKSAGEVVVLDEFQIELDGSEYVMAKETIKEFKGECPTFDITVGIALTKQLLKLGNNTKSKRATKIIPLSKKELSASEALQALIADSNFPPCPTQDYLEPAFKSVLASMNVPYTSYHAGKKAIEKWAIVCAHIRETQTDFKCNDPIAHQWLYTLYKRPNTGFYEDFYRILDEKPHWLKEIIESDAISTLTSSLAEYLGFRDMEKDVFSFASSVLRCLIILLQTKPGLVIALNCNTVQVLSFVLAHEAFQGFSKHVLKILTVVTLMGSNAHSAVLDSLALASRVFSLPSNRFYLILSHLETSSDFMVKGVCLSFINAIVNSPKLLETRVALRNELNSLNFNLLLEEIEDLILKTALPTSFLCSQIILYEESLMKDERASLLNLCHSSPVRTQRQLVGNLLVEAENHNVVSELMSFFTYMLRIDTQNPKEQGKGFYCLIKQIIQQISKTKKSISLTDLLPGRIWDDLLGDLPKENNVLKQRITDREAELATEMLLQNDLKDVLRDSRKLKSVEALNADLEALLGPGGDEEQVINALQARKVFRPPFQKTVPLIQTWTTSLLMSEVDQIVNELVLSKNSEVLGNSSKEQNILNKMIHEIKVNETNKKQRLLTSDGFPQKGEIIPEDEPTTALNVPVQPKAEFQRNLGKQRLSSRKNEPFKVKILNWTIIPDYQISSTLWSKGESYLPPDLTVDIARLHKAFVNDLGTIFSQQIHLLERFIHSHLLAFLTGYQIDSHIKRQQICKALDQIDERPFEHDPHPFGQLLECLPFSSNLKSLLQSCLQYDMDNTQFDIPSRFAIGLHAIPNLSHKARCIRFFINFKSHIVDIKYEVLIIKQALKTLREEMRLIRLFSLILDVGNIFNANDPLLKDAAGFQLHSLSELSKVKGADGSTLLEYVVGLALSQQPDLLEMDKTYCNVKLAAAINLEEVVKNIRGLLNEYNSAIVAAKKIQNAPESLQSKFKNIYDELLYWIYNLKETQIEIAEVYTYFAWSSTNPNTSHFFSHLEQFLYEINVAKQKVSLSLSLTLSSEPQPKSKKKPKTARNEGPAHSVDDFFTNLMTNSSKIFMK